MFEHFRVGSALKAGLIATGVMTALMYAAPLVGLPRMDVIYSLGSLLPGSSSPYVVGALLHFGIGAILALVYAASFSQVLPGPGWTRGTLFSLLPWIFAVVAMPSLMALLQSLFDPGTAAAALNPCAAANPCAPIANPCAAVSSTGGEGGGGQMFIALLSLANHLVYGGILGFVYPRQK